jgi:cytochrome c oxidase assembly protein subunit 15
VLSAAPSFPGDYAAPRVARTPASSVASWLGVLFVMLFVLNTVGGWVRLSGAGVAIPQWPIINGSLLPPFGDEGWVAVKATYDADQQRLQTRILAGELTRANLGRVPQDLGEFKYMFMTEWSHRLLAALVGVLAAGCLTVVWRQPAVRRVVGVPMTIAGALVVVQAVVGGVLVHSGTNTNWLFLHQGNAGLIMACVLVSMLRLLAEGQPTVASADLLRRRRLAQAIAIGAVLVWCQLVVGALVAGSRNDGQFAHWPLGAAVRVWDEQRSLLGNLYANTDLHQWAHRWLAWTVMTVMGLIGILAWRLRRLPAMGQRLRLALQVAATFVVIQMMLGLGNALLGITAYVSLAHQFMGMCLFMALVLAWFDARREPALPTPAAAAGGGP